MTSRPQVRIGLLHDTADLADPGPGDFDSAEWIARECAALAATGVELPGVEFVHAYALGLPSGTAEAVERAIDDLAGQSVALIAGPSLADNAIVASARVDALRIPAINWADTARACSKWMFQLPTGSHEREPAIIVSALATQGCQRVAVLHEQTPSAVRMLRHFSEAAIAAGLQMHAIALRGTAMTDAASAIADAKGAQADALAHLGEGSVAVRLADAAANADWHGPAFMNASAWRTCMRRGTRAPMIWRGLETTSSGNAVLAGLRATPELALKSAADDVLALGHDLGRLIAHALANAPELSPRGVRHALHTMAPLPAAMGIDTARLSFQPHHHTAITDKFPLAPTPVAIDVAHRLDVSGLT